jgi:hypothetical protein
MLKLLRAALAFFAAEIGMRELTLYMGLGLAGYGLYQIYPPAAFVAPGAVLDYVAIFGVR